MNNYIFENQFKEEILKEAIKIGFRISKNKSFNETLLEFITVRSKLIEPKHRIVKMSPPLLSKLFTHYKRKEIEHIFHQANSGNNINLFQSKKLLQSRFHDHMLNEWHIYHFHLSLELEKKSKFAKQVDDLLFAYVDQNHIIFLDVDKHKPGIFANEKWLEILHDFFPELISEFKVEHWKDVNPKVNSEERQQIWDKGYTLGFTKIRNTVYFSSGVGRSTSGHGMDVTRNVDSIIRWMHKLDIQISESIQELCSYLNTAKEKIDFKVIFGSEHLQVVEMSSKISIVNFPEVLISKEELLEKLKGK